MLRKLVLFCLVLFAAAQAPAATAWHDPSVDRPAPQLSAGHFQATEA